MDSARNGSVLNFLDKPAQDILDWRYTPTTLSTTIILSLLVIVITRILSALNSPSKPSSPNGAYTIPRAPYWIPLLGNLPEMGWDATAFTTALRSRFPNGAFSLNFGGITHNVFYHPGLSTALLGQKPHIADFEDVTNRLMHVVFGIPKRDASNWKAAVPDLMACYRFLLADPELGELVRRTAAETRLNTPNLVTFSKSPVDETAWERTSNVRTIPPQKAGGEEVVEADLLPLIRDFCAHSANATLVGSDFLHNFPDYFYDLWTMDRGMLLLAAGLPRWLPIITLTRAHIARKRMLNRLETFHTALEKWANDEDPGADWSDLDDISDLLKARMKAYRRHNLSIAARAATENALIWAANANSDMLVFWMVNRIYSDGALLSALREEIAPFVRAIQPPRQPGLPIAEPPRFEVFDVEGLCSSCPLLKSCYVESLRLDTASWSLKYVKQDFVLQARGAGAAAASGAEKDGPSWVLRKGEYAHAAHDLHNTDPAYFEDPLVWRADRHVRYEKGEGKGQASAELGSVRSYGGGSSMCKGRAFAFKECMVFAAAIIAMWDFEPAGSSKEWRMPRHRKAMGVYGTSDTTRVRVKRRPLPTGDVN